MPETSKTEKRPAPPQAPMFQQYASREAEPEWHWRYSPFCGVMYGPIPIGLIIAIPILLALGAR